MADPTHLDRRDRLPRDLAARRTLVGMIGTAAVVVVGLGSLAIASDRDPQPASSDRTSAPEVAASADGSLPAASEAAPDPAPSTDPVPAGLTPVSGPGGGIVGYLRVEDERAVLDAGEPAIQLGTSEVDFRGLPVVDRHGAQVGWFLSGDLGFVATAEVYDPERLAAIEATWLAEHPDAAP